jgi:anthranilate phosphoribosyltransferase
VPTATPDQLTGGTPRENAGIITAVLRGEGNRGATDAVVLNAAAAIYVSGRVDSFREAVDAARDALGSGAGLAALERLRSAAPRTTSG